jgi:hypothetical protein
MKLLKYVVLSIALFVFASVAMSADEQSIDEEIGMKASRSMLVTAMVSAINQETREVTLTTEAGGVYSFVASEKARNLDQVDVGDIVTAAYEHNIVLEVIHADDLIEREARIELLKRSELGDKPAAETIQRTVKMLSVVNIDLETMTFKLKDADGIVNEFAMANVANLKRVAVGDFVVATDTQKMALSVEEVPSSE